MKTNYLVKSFIFPSILVSMGLLYLVGQSKIQVVHLMHTISHNVWIVMPLEGMNHSQENARATHHEHNFLEYDTIFEKVHYHEKKESNVYSHRLLPFLSTVFDSGENKGEKQEWILEVKVDKHILLEHIKEKVSLPIIEKLNTFFHVDKACKIGLNVMTPPPKIDLS